MRAYSVGQYRDSDTGRTRWAVFCNASRVWYFPKRHGRKEAERLLSRMLKPQLATYGIATKGS